MRAPAVLVVLLAATGAGAADVDVSFRLLNRFVYQRDQVQTLLLYDPALSAFRTQDYLSPTVDGSSSIHVASLLLDAALGRGWSLTALLESGALRVGRQNLSEPAAFRVGLRRVTVPVLTTRTELELTANGLPVSDEARRSLFLREAYFAYADGGLSAVLGKRRVVLADGFLFDQFAIGAGLRLGDGGRDRPARWRVYLDALVADGSFDAGGKASPVLHLGVHWLPGALQHFGFTLVYFHDGDNVFSEVFRASITEASVERAGLRPLLALQVPLASSGDVLWFGLSGKRFLGDHTVGGLLFGQAGRVRASSVLPPLGTRQAPTLVEVDAAVAGLLADAYYQYDLTEDVSLGGFFTLATGDDGLSDAFRQGGRSPTLGAFLSLFPFVARSNLFFNGGLNAELTLRKASTLGVNARGLLAAGAFARWDGRRVRLEGRVVALGAHRPSIHDGKHYGTEIDLNARFPFFGNRLALVAEADFLFTGSFFARRRTVTQLIVGVDATLP